TAVGRAFPPRAYVYLATVPVYSLGEWGFTVGSKGPDPSQPRLPEDAPLPFPTRYYTLELHRAAFALPRYVQELLGLVQNPCRVLRAAGGFDGPPRDDGRVQDPSARHLDLRWGVCYNKRRCEGTTRWEMG